jgi:hypothetical protein
MRGKSESKSVGQEAVKVLVSPSQTRSPTFIEKQWMGAQLGLPLKAASTDEQTPNVSPALLPQQQEEEEVEEEAGGGGGSGAGGIQTGSLDQNHVRKQRLPSSESPGCAHESTNADAAAVAAHGAAAVAVRIWQMTHSHGVCVVWFRSLYIHIVGLFYLLRLSLSLVSGRCFTLTRSRTLAHPLTPSHTLHALASGCHGGRPQNPPTQHPRAASARRACLHRPLQEIQGMRQGLQGARKRCLLPQTHPIPTCCHEAKETYYKGKRDLV